MPDEAFAHTRSRALLMREYLRRTARWARAYGAERAWRFFDITEYVDPSLELPSDIAAQLDDFLQSGPGRDAVRWATLRAEAKVRLPDLSDPYEPLLLMYEHGGGFYTEEFIELDGISMRRGSLESNLSARPFRSLASTTLDALDENAKGKITYYAKIDTDFPRINPLGIVRRRIYRKTIYDEAFTRNLHWEPTEYLKLYVLSHNDIDHAEISAIETAEFIEKVTRKITQ